ncbi:MAG: hypothetical protein VKJ02_13605 [Snowella sp.]|nr:hypothetical protein [Snowella sp.]
MNSLNLEDAQRNKNQSNQLTASINSQYLLIDQYLQQFDENKLPFDRLISVLDALLETLQVSDDEWKEKFRSEWWTLEQVYAVACDRGETTLNIESQNLVCETLDNMKKLLKELSKNWV